VNSLPIPNGATLPHVIFQKLGESGIDLCPRQLAFPSATLDLNEDLWLTWPTQQEFARHSVSAGWIPERNTKFEMSEQVGQAEFAECLIALAILAFEVANEASEITVKVGEVK